jgi:hypothetical protein
LRSTQGFGISERFHIEQAKSLEREIAEQLTVRTKRTMSKSTIYAALTALKKFFHWLAGHPGYRSRLSYSDAGYFTMSEKDARVPRAQRERPVPTRWPDEIGKRLLRRKRDSYMVLASRTDP